MNVTTPTPSPSASHSEVRKIQKVWNAKPILTAISSEWSAVNAAIGARLIGTAIAQANQASHLGSAPERRAATPTPPRNIATKMPETIRANR